VTTGVGYEIKEIKKKTLKKKRVGIRKNVKRSNKVKTIVSIDEVKFHEKSTIFNAVFFLKGSCKTYRNNLQTNEKKNVKMLLFYKKKKILNIIYFVGILFFLYIPSISEGALDERGSWPVHAVCETESFMTTPCERMYSEYKHERHINHLLFKKQTCQRTKMEIIKTIPE
jgi:hypothetical protein